VPRAITVWEVELGKPGPSEELKGTLELSHRDLIFTPRDEARPTVKIPLDEISKVKRLRGSPVLMVLRETAAGHDRIAFYFAQPPPIGALRGERVEPSGQSAFQRRASLGALEAFRNPKRRARRDNISYLGLMNRENKALLKEWVKAVGEAVGRAREGAGGPVEG
jgi:hypothetical protein